MISQTEFVSHVADGYKHLYDLVYLRAHSLADLLLPSLAGKQRARRLHQMLLEVIEELDPGPLSPPFSPEWRRHRLVVLRYIRGLAPQAVADQLAVGLRHYYRLHKAAIQDIAHILWDRCLDHCSMSEESQRSVEGNTSHERLELLRLEAARLAQADRYAHVAEVIRGVLSLLDEMLRHHQLDLRLMLPEPLPGVSIGQSLLRQILLGLLVHLIEGAERATIRVTAQVESSTVHLSLRVEPPEAAHAISQAKIQEQLSAFAGIAALTDDGRISPVYAAQSLTGFDVQLPTAERVVLVVDDNKDVLDLFRAYLSSHGYRVATAQTAQEGLSQARRLQPYAITLDLMMPAQDGWDLLQTLLNQPDLQHIPIIVCSVLKQRELALSLGATAFLGKPISEEMLRSALEALEEK